MLTAVVLAKNESSPASRFRQCLKSLAFCDHVVVVNDNSSDDTAKVAAKLGAGVLNHPVAGDFSAQRNWVMDQVKSPWLLFVDADEVISPSLAAEIRSRLEKDNSYYLGYYLPRVDHLWGQALRHGDVGHVRLLRLGRRGSGPWSGRVHETWKVAGRTAVLTQPLLHYPHPGLAEFLRHLNNYSTIRAGELFDQSRRSSLFEIIFYPPAKFLWLWVVKLGFADGTAGFVHAMCMAFYTFLVRAKLWLLPKGIPSQ